MATPQPPSARFRSATEFPKTIERLNPPEAEQLYIEMRDCLIFTNRSRAQLVRRNEEHKQSTLQLKSDVEQLQHLIQRLNLEKQQSVANNQQTVSELTDQITSMASHLDQLTEAFDAIADIENPTGFIAQPSRFFRFIRALKAIVLFWREGQDDQSSSSALPGSGPLPSGYGTDADRRSNPQMYQDQASINRSLLDD
jgi:hypothetical protein